MSPPSRPSDHRALFLPKVRVRGLVVGGDHVGRVPPCHRSRRALHHHQPDGRLCGLRVRGVLLGGIFAPAVVHDTRYQEHQEQDNVAGDEDAEVQSDRVDLLVVLQKAHGDVCMLGFPEAWEKGASEVSGRMWRCAEQACGSSSASARSHSILPAGLLPLACLPACLLASRPTP